MLVLQVFIMRNGAFEGTEMVTGDRVEIGRDQGNALVLEDESCSRRHAVLFEHDGKLAIQDLGSANGTRINGEPVTSARFVNARDDIAIGVFTLKIKVMTGKQAVPSPVVAPSDPTRIVAAPTPQQLAQAQSPALAPTQPSGVRAPLGLQQAQPQNPASIAVGAASMERTQVLPPEAPTEVKTATLRPSALDADRTLAGGRPPPMPPLSDERPAEHSGSAPRPVAGAGAFARQQQMAARASVSETTSRDTRPVPSPSQTLPSQPDVTAPEAQLPALLPRPQASASSAAAVNESTTRPAISLGAVALQDFPIPDDAGDAPPMVFAPKFTDDELHEEDDEEVPWSLVQRLVRPTQDKNKDPLLEVVHYRGELVVDHQVLREGDMFRLGDRMSRAERRDRGIPKPIPLVRLKKGGVAEVFQHAEVQGKLLRGGQQTDLSTTKGGAVPITDGELASLKVGNERVFLRFAGSPQLIWTRDDAAEDRFARRLNALAGGSSIGLFSLMAVASWIYQYRNADQEVIALEDEGFADVEIKMPEMETPPEPEKPPDPVAAPEPTPDQKVEKAMPSVKPEKQAEAAPAKPGVLDILNNIPKVNDTASNQNLTAALSNIKGVRVPGGAAPVKVSSLIGKGPTSGVQIGGSAGGLSTSGINSLIRKDGQAGALGGKGDRAVAGKVTTLPRQIQKTGGELSKEEIQKVINQHIGEIQYCYEKALRTQPGLAGRVVLDWTVNPAGKVSVVKVATSSLGSPEATNCMMSKLKTWKFPPPRGGAVTIVYPFVFNTV